MAALLAEICPRCGKHLALRGDDERAFIGCSGFPSCRYTRSIKPTEREWALWIPPTVIRCQTCKDSGSVPFIRTDGLISQSAQMVCPDCGGYNHERSYADARRPDRIPSDYDFPCSDTWRGFYQGENIVQKEHR